MSTTITSTKLREIAKSAFPKLVWEGQDLKVSLRQGTRVIEAHVSAEIECLGDAYIICRAGKYEGSDITWAWLEAMSAGPEGGSLTIAEAVGCSPEKALKLLRLNIQSVMSELQNRISPE